ncbi:hypothetical protein L227DRAFT_568552 [Lentinus tigrinus ALCF2SS1-6]|uniref:Uncharacterized protein n=1 Tax=Lentinus tigrinus ALCF2SS1-6 TaxID=1328759 RepID=A0A5C2RLN2_9APHY|nr:hypothetical protein L227DRAFT_568552 [Lentinus tigrinus ALCF2SS1-6]
MPASDYSIRMMPYINTTHSMHLVQQLCRCAVLTTCTPRLRPYLMRSLRLPKANHLLSLLFPTVIDVDDEDEIDMYTPSVETSDHHGNDVQILLEKSLHGLRRLMAERLTPAALDRLDSRNCRHRQLITRKVEDYFAARQRIAYLQHQSSSLTNDVTIRQQTVKDMKRRLSKETARSERIRRSQTKESNDIKLVIARANQRIQCHLRHERRGTVPSKKHPINNSCYVSISKRREALRGSREE